jgi:hypothetical protein
MSARSIQELNCASYRRVLAGSLVCKCVGVGRVDISSVSLLFFSSFEVEQKKEEKKKKKKSTAVCHSFDKAFRSRGPSVTHVSRPCRRRRCV